MCLLNHRVIFKPSGKVSDLTTASSVKVFNRIKKILKNQQQDSRLTVSVLPIKPL